MTDVPSRIDRAREIVNNLDRVTPHVFIDAKIVEANVSFSRSLGIDWTLKGGPIFKDFFKGAFGYDVGFSYPVPSPGTVGFTFSKILGTPLELSAKISAAEEDKKAKLISSPRIKTTNNKEAIISQGIEYPYLERDESGLPTVKFKEINLKLTVTPQVTNDNRIYMKIILEKDDVAQLIQTVLGTVPALSTNDATTNVLVDDGNTIVIGGIIKSDDRKTTTGFPVLSKIPVLGWLFKSQIKTKEDTELIIFITPRIVKMEQRIAQN